MSIEEVIEKTTIELPREIDLETAEELLRYLAGNLSANIHYNVSYFKSILKKDGEISEFDGSVSLTANISSYENPTAFDACTFMSSSTDTSKLSIIKFGQVPGWDLSEYRQEVRQLWDDVRETVKQYFEQRWL